MLVGRNEIEIRFFSVLTVINNLTSGYAGHYHQMIGLFHFTNNHMNSKRSQKTYNWNATKDTVSTIGPFDHKMTVYVHTIPLRLLANIRTFVVDFLIIKLMHVIMIHFVIFHNFRFQN